jgi:hypothetical protein
VELAGVYTGARGPTAFDAAGDRAQAAYDLWAIQEADGQFVWRHVSRTIEPAP